MLHLNNFVDGAEAEDEPTPRPTHSQQSDCVRPSLGRTLDAKEYGTRVPRETLELEQQPRIQGRSTHEDESVMFWKPIV